MFDVSENNLSKDQKMSSVKERLSKELLDNYFAEFLNLVVNNDKEALLEHLRLLENIVPDNFVQNVTVEHNYVTVDIHLLSEAKESLDFYKLFANWINDNPHGITITFDIWEMTKEIV
jgi:hypothetical protein